MEMAKGVVVAGQQIGAGWTPALSVVKALAANVVARRRGLSPIYWLADEDHDREEVSSVVALHGDRLTRHRFSFSAPQGMASGWLEWTDAHQREAQDLWGRLPAPLEPSLRGHVMALGGALWERGIVPYSPTKDADRAGIQDELERWRTLDIEGELCLQADLLESKGEAMVLDPRRQSAWFSLDPKTGGRRRLDSGQKCPKGHWLSPGAALRPLMQSLLLPAEVVVLGPGEMSYWRLIERAWDRLGLKAPLIVPRPSVFVLHGGPSDLSPEDLENLRLGRWEAFAASGVPGSHPATPGVPGPHPAAGMPPKPSQSPLPAPIEAWGQAISRRFVAEMDRLEKRLKRLDARLAKDTAKKRLGENIERLRQTLFPFGKPQERVIPGWYWLQSPQMLDAVEHALEGALERGAGGRIVVDVQR
jgi:hypothetical protein